MHLPNPLSLAHGLRPCKQEFFLPAPEALCYHPLWTMPPLPSKGAPSLRTTWKSLVESPEPDTEFVLDPYIPKVGKVLLYGTTSVGKSPVMWGIAAAVASGKPFLGLPTRKTPVLIIETDSTYLSTKRRIARLKGPIPEDVHFLFFPGLNIPGVKPEHVEAIVGALRDINPGLVFLNSLRKIHDLDDKDSKTVKLVYEWCDRMFGGRAVCFVHHERKNPTTADSRDVEVSRERFSGAMNWLNDAQVGLHLKKGKGPEGSNLKLMHVKSQETELYRPMPLRLWPDGTNLSNPTADKYNILQEFIDSHPGALMREVDYKVGLIFGCSDRIVRDMRSRLASGEYPGPGFLGKQESEVEEETPLEVVDLKGT